MASVTAMLIAVNIAIAATKIEIMWLVCVKIEVTIMIHPDCYR